VTLQPLAPPAKEAPRGVLASVDLCHSGRTRLDVLGVLRLSQASYAKMLQNLAWATSYNLLAVPAAAGSLAWAGITLSAAQFGQ
jgi:cation transport ATPase